MSDDAYGVRAHVRQLSLPAIQDPETSWFDGWYLDLRLEEEVARALRYGLALSLIVLILQKPVRSQSDSLLLSERLRAIARSGLRRADLPAVAGEGIYAVMLPHTNRAQAGVVAARLVRTFAPFAFHLGIACCPDDERVSERLFALAESNAHESPEQQPPRASVKSAWG